VNANGFNHCSRSSIFEFYDQIQQWFGKGYARRGLPDWWRDVGPG
jgi:hypothetical protein